MVVKVNRLQYRGSYLESIVFVAIILFPFGRLLTISITPFWSPQQMRLLKQVQTKQF